MEPYQALANAIVRKPFLDNLRYWEWLDEQRG